MYGVLKRVWLFIHLFLEDQRKIIIDKIYGMLNKNGVAYFITSSDQDEDYRKGKAIGDHLIVNERGVMKYYYNEDSIKKEFQIFDRIEINTFSEMHTHDYLHEHINYVIKCIKQGDKIQRC